MSDIALKQVHFAGITMQIPEIWNYETGEYTEEDGTTSYTLSISAKGKDVRTMTRLETALLDILQDDCRIGKSKKRNRNRINGKKEHQT